MESNFNANAIGTWEWSIDGKTKTTRHIRIYFGMGENTKVLHHWQMPIKLYMKYHWVFRLRECHAQIKHPRERVTLQISDIKEDLLVDEVIKHLKNKIINRKAKITEFNGKIFKFRSEWNQLFPVEEYEPYKNAIARVERAKKELEEFEKLLKHD